jgi:hypothetical protein
MLRCMPACSNVRLDILCLLVYVCAEAIVQICPSSLVSSGMPCARCASLACVGWDGNFVLHVRLYCICILGRAR